MNFLTMILGFKYENVVNFTLIMYSYCKLLKWFIDKVNIEEHGFTRACIWMKGFMVLYIVAPPNLVCNSMSIDWNMGAACYAFVAGATSRDPYSVTLIGVWVLRATPPWREPPPETLIP